MAEAQSYRNHTRLDPQLHFFVAPVLLVNVLVAVGVLIHHWPHDIALHLWLVVLAAALLVLASVARSSALRAQDRVIRLEETLRYQRLFSPEELASAAGLNVRQIIALRFASDAKLPELARRAAGENLPDEGDQAGDYGMAGGSVAGIRVKTQIPFGNDNKSGKGRLSDLCAGAG